jgi:hypothetical protein
MKLKIGKNLVKIKFKVMKTIDDFIKELQRISEDKRKLPLVVQCPNGELTSPSIKMMWDEPLEMLEKNPDKMFISWRD